ncbi:MAG TPA: glycosyltransferase [Allosphingosinicella sp.]|jgi:glycosyltransferase involved in cell wall biosynthesis
MLRVLTLATLFPDAGRPDFGRFVLRQTQALAAREGVDVEVVAPVALPPWPLSLHPHYAGRARLPARDAVEGLRVHRPRFRTLPRIGEAGGAKAMARAALPVARAFRPDVIDAEFFWPDGIAAMHLAAALGVPFSIKARGSDIAYWSTRPKVLSQMLEAAAAADGLLAVSEALKRDMAALGMPAEKIAVHYTGIDLNRFRPIDKEAAKARLGISGPLLVSVGALVPVKGQALAIAALAQLPDASLVLVGDGPERARLEAAARAMGVAARVRFARAVPHGELPALLAAADIMVLPSEREGLANAWLEALACGVPLVIPDVGGAREVLDRPEAGRIVAREPAAIAAAVRDILDHPPEAAAVRSAAERFSWKVNGEALHAHLAAIARAPAL